MRMQFSRIFRRKFDSDVQVALQTPQSSLFCCFQLVLKDKEICFLKYWLSSPPPFLAVPSLPFISILISLLGVWPRTETELWWVGLESLRGYTPLVPLGWTTPPLHSLAIRDSQSSPSVSSCFHIAHPSPCPMLSSDWILIGCFRVFLFSDLLDIFLLLSASPFAEA